MVLTGQEAVVEHVVDKLLPSVGIEMRPIEGLRVRPVISGDRLAHEQFPIDQLGERALDRMVMRLQRVPTFLRGPAADPASAMLALDQRRPRDRKSTRLN